jgi:hypothetical protein
MSSISGRANHYVPDVSPAANDWPSITANISKARLIELQMGSTVAKAEKDYDQAEYTQCCRHDKPDTLELGAIPHAKSQKDKD